MLSIKDLTVSVDGKRILKKFNLDIKIKEIHALMGLNGSGKSTICKVLMGDPRYNVESGTIIYKGHDLLSMDTTTRSREGLYLINQSPIEIEGVKNSEMLRLALEARTGKSVNIFEFSKLMNNIVDKIGLDKSFIHRGINENMSGGERKKNELMHLWVLEPDLVLIDEIDSGVDVDNLNIISNSLKEYFDTHNCSYLIITHHNNILEKLTPKYVHIINNGTIINTGDKSLAIEVEKNGFNSTNKVSES